jgi:hypothetical protein
MSKLDLGKHLRRQRAFSYKTFGPGERTEGIIDHIQKELDEIRNSPYDVEEWIDVVILAFDGAWRSGHAPWQIVDALYNKQRKNEARTWPDWRTAPKDKAIEHEEPNVRRSEMVSGRNKARSSKSSNKKQGGKRQIQRASKKQTS